MENNFEFDRIQRLIYELKKYIVKEIKVIEKINLLNEDGEIYTTGNYFGEKNKKFLFGFKIKLEPLGVDEALYLSAYTSKNETDNSLNPQMKIYIDDDLIQGLDVNHQHMVIPLKYLDGKYHEFKIDLNGGREEKQFPLYVEIQTHDELTKSVYYDLFVLLDSWRALDKSDPNYYIYEKQLGKSVNKLWFFDVYSENYITKLKEIQSELKDQFYSENNDTHFSTVRAVGHTHIDLAWLWTTSQAIEKGEKSFQTMLSLMDKYDDFTFIQSQPQLYEWIKEIYPSLYEKIKEKIKEKKWQPEGAMWVEADCNLTSGESLVRQFLYGKRFFKKEFDLDSKILWLPDVFGYSAALPQIMKKSGVDYFMTSKLSWNQYNRIPFDSFYWQGIDGSRILTHFITTISEGYSPTPYYSTYNGLLEPYTIKKSWEKYLEKKESSELLLAFGYGDGGGGPTEDMLEVLSRMKYGLPSMPKVESTNVIDFFNKLKNELLEHKEKQWLGELYFEYHRGTYTTVAKNKKNNRLAESYLQSLEKLCVTSNLSYAEDFFEKHWKKLLLNQFHDILPGSSIKEVYDQTDLDYQSLFIQGKEILEKLSDEKNSDCIYIFNSIDKSMTRFVELELDQDISIYGNSDAALTTQQTYDDKLLVAIPDLPSMAGVYLKLKNTKNKHLSTPYKPQSLLSRYDTQDYTIEFNESYQIKSLYDKKNCREVVLKESLFNELIVYEDIPLNYDAWDIDYFYRLKSKKVTDVLSANIVEKGELRDVLAIEWSFQKSRITQYLIIWHGKQKIDFKTKVDWHEHHSLLKSSFGIDVNTLAATFDIQFGNVERPIHKNTSWDVARFEVCGQKWVDLSDHSYGVSLLTDSKYGFDTNYQHLGLSLLRSSSDPYLDADIGIHEFTYSIHTHQKGWREAQTVNYANDLNIKPLVIENPSKNLPIENFITNHCPNLIIDTMKKAEDSEEVVIRIYENENKRTEGEFHFSREIKEAWSCNLLEENTDKLIVSDNSITILFKPYEIQTIKVSF